MNIQTIFHQAIDTCTPTKKAQSTIADYALGNIYITDDIEHNDSPVMLDLLAGGVLKTTYPWFLEVHSMPCSILIYTREGHGTITSKTKTLSLPPTSMLLFSCKDGFRLNCTTEVWNFQIFYLYGEMLKQYDSILSNAQEQICSFSSGQETVHILDELCSLHPDYTLSQRLLQSDLIHRVLTTYMLNLLNEKKAENKIPAYIVRMKNLFDNSFTSDYSLDDLENTFNISKYRLCREFKQAYQLSIIQYINQNRINMAKHLLVTTDDRIHEIGSAVGIDNTNHFIHLFRQFTGTTPLAYRQLNL